MPTQAEIEAARLVIRDADVALFPGASLDWAAVAKAALEAAERVRQKNAAEV